ncbi:c-type cytochrome [Fulvivirga ligni]|uniref:c-type cytochrome n=1 Tax=Fulvivirga ligni TaxID=2904246 RepID=UPI001F46F784|nr:cytochrome c [Fulvivirga ligni]UII20991.1 cytochrome c [Fulvivirga ligni]
MKRNIGFTAVVALFGLLILTAMKTHPQQEGGLEKSIARGKLVYEQNCLSCHQANGGGVPNIAPTLSQTTYVLEDKKKLIHIVLDGFNEDVEINGMYFSNPMPSFDALSDQQVADVLTYIRNNFENKAEAITTAEVKAERGK